MFLDGKEVDVLLATYNGGKYLSEFLDSLAKQEGVTINLYVSDDNSDDDTLQIVNSYHESFKLLRVLRGPEIGPAGNFFSLLEQGYSEFTAFADQDDIWEKDHLIKSVERIEKYGEIPALTFCDVYEFYFDKSKNRVWPNLDAEPTITQISVQNFARGCTLVFNRSSKDLLLEKPVNDVIMHDWWLYLLIASCGEVVYSKTTEIQYRVHDGNFIGVHRKSRKLGERIKEPWPTIDQLERLLQNYQSHMKDHERTQLLEFYGLFLKSTRMRCAYVLKFKGRLRSNLLDEFKIRVAIALLPFKSKSALTSQIKSSF
jgi:glycosyltransferase involved in cell wall biosynthesis